MNNDLLLSLLEKDSDSTINFLNSLLLVSLLGYSSFSFIKNLTTKVIIESDYITKSSLFKVTKINYRDISSVSFQCRTSTKPTPWLTLSTFFNIYIELTDIHKNSIIIFTNSLPRESITRLFTYIINNVDSLKNNQDYKNIAEGKYTQDDFYRLAGVLDAVNLTRFDLNDTMGSPALKVLHYISIAGAILFILLFVLGIVIVMQ